MVFLNYAAHAQPKFKELRKSYRKHRKCRKRRIRKKSRLEKKKIQVIFSPNHN